jgi:hypothetical protein
MHRIRVRLAPRLAAGLLLLPLVSVGVWAEASSAGPPAGTVAAGAPTRGAADGSAAAGAAVTPLPLPPPFTVPVGVTAADTPSDGGGSITVRWKAVSGARRYRIERAESGQEYRESGIVVARAGKNGAKSAGENEEAYADESCANGVPYTFRVVAVGPGGEEGVSAATVPAMSGPQWFNRHLTLVLLAVIGLILLTVHFIRGARSGKRLFIRRIAGLEAVDEAVGRATEMGRPVLFLTGIADIDQIPTIAALNVLGEVARKTAEYGTILRVPNNKPVVYAVAREVVTGAYAAAGRPDAYDPQSVFFLVENVQAYAAAICGIMIRDQPAANFLLGEYSGESLVLAETGATTGAIQIAGTNATAQLPFFVVACDYTLIGEELYAASAYLSREPLAVGALKGQDWGKVVLMAFLVIGTLLALVTGLDVGSVLETAAR